MSMPALVRVVDRRVALAVRDRSGPRSSRPTRLHGARAPARRPARPSPRPPSPPDRCRRAAPRSRGAARPGAACSSPSARGSRRRARGTESARRRRSRAGSARRPCNRRFGRSTTGNSPRNAPDGLGPGAGRSSSTTAFACAMLQSSSSSAERNCDLFRSTLPFCDPAVRRLEEAELVDARVGRERGDQSDVRAFRRLDRAHAAVVRVVHVAHLEAGALARQPARSERRQAALVRELRQRIGLVHELRELARSEEALDHRGDRARVDQVVRRDLVAGPGASCAPG